MGMKLGGSVIAKLYVGTSLISAAYAGTGLVWNDDAVELPDPDLVPNAATFTTVTDAELNTLTLSEYLIPTGYNTQTTISVVGGEYQINAGIWRSIDHVINPGDAVRVRRNSSNLYETGAQVVLTIGGVAMPFTVITLQQDIEDPDLIPDGASFTSITGAEPSTVITSEYITPTGYDAQTDVTIVGGEYQIEAGAWVSTPGTIDPGSDIRVRRSSSAAFNTSVEVVVTIGGVPMAFSVTTRVADIAPNAFGFTAVNNAEINTQTVSEYITPTGYEAGSPVTIVGGEYQIEAGAWTNAAGTINPDETIRVRRNSSGAYETAVDVILTIGGIAGTFTITTKVDPASLDLSSTLTQTSADGGNPMTWQSNFATEDAVVWDGTNGDMFQIRHRVDGGAWVTEVYQGLDDEFYTGGFTWPLYVAASPFAAGVTVEVQERRCRFAGGVKIAEGDWCPSISDVMAAPPVTMTLLDFATDPTILFDARSYSGGVGAVSTVPNQGTTGGNAVQATAGDRPVFEAAGLNGLPCFYQDAGNGDGLDFAGTWGPLNGLSGAGNTTQLQAEIAAGAVASSAMPRDMVNPCVVAIRFTAGTPGSIRFYQDGNVVNTNSTQPVTVSSTLFAVIDLVDAGPFGFGRIVTPTQIGNRSTDGRALNGRWSVLANFDYAMADADVDKAFGILNHAFDLEAHLPSAHTWKANPPTI
jgi:hypothetical protein